MSMSKEEAHSIAMNLSLKELEDLILAYNHSQQLIDLLKLELEEVKSLRRDVREITEIQSSLLDHYNNKAIEYLNVKNGFPEKGKYHEWLNEPIMQDIKNIIKHIRFLNTVPHCEKCKKETAYLIMHHTAYDWNELYSPAYLRFLCKKCNNEEENHNNI